MVITLTQRLEQERKKLLDFQVRLDSTVIKSTWAGQRDRMLPGCLDPRRGLQEKYKIRVKNEAAPADSLQPSRGTQGVLTEKPA